MGRFNLDNFERRTIKGRKYDYEIRFRWMDFSFPWLGNYWYQQVNQQNIWYMVKRYPWIVRDRVAKNYGVDLGYDPVDMILMFLEETGVIVFKGDNIPYHAAYQLYAFGEMVRSYFQSDSGDYLI